MNKKNKVKHPFTLVFNKEMKSIFRDKRMMISLLAPIILVPALMAIVGIAVTSFLNQTTVVGTNQLENPLIIELQNQPGTHFEFVEIENYQHQIQNGSIIAAIVFADTFVDDVSSQHPTSVEIITESSNQGAMTISESLQMLVSQKNDLLLHEILTTNNLSPEVTSLITLKSATLSKDGQVKESTGFDEMFAQFSGIIPMMVILGSVSGVFTIATELGAGEKEKNSFETLLTTKADRKQIIAGKLLATITFGFISLLAFLSTFLVIGIGIFILFPTILTLIGAEFSMLAFVLSLIILVLTTAFISCLALIISMFAKTYKESQAYLGYMSFAFILPTYFTMFTDLRNLPTWQLHVPLFNHIVILKQILNGVYDWTNIAIVITWSILYIVITVIGLRTLLSKEKFLFN